MRPWWGGGSAHVRTSDWICALVHQRVIGYGLSFMVATWYLLTQTCARDSAVSAGEALGDGQGHGRPKKRDTETERGTRCKKQPSRKPRDQGGGCYAKDNGLDA